MAFIATLICKSMALRDGIASASIDFNISKQNIDTKPISQLTTVKHNYLAYGQALSVC
jgi:hypothetical protein